MREYLQRLSIGAKFMMFILVTLFIATAFFVIWSNTQLRKQSLKQAKETAFAASQLVKASLTTLMAADAMDERGRFFKELSKLNGLNEVRVFRSETVNKDFDGGKSDERPQDEAERQVINTGNAFYRIEGQENGSSQYRVTIPYAAEKSCVSSCHESAKVGEILGGISLRVSLEEVEKDIARQQWILILVGLVGLVAIILAFRFCLNALVVKPIDQVVERIKDIAQGEGDLTQRLKAKGEDEIGTLVQWFNTFLDQLHEIIGRVAGAANQVASSSDSLLSIADKTASEAKEQALQTDQAAAAMQEISNAIVDVTKNAIQASEAAEETGKTAGRGEGIVSQAMGGMTRIAEVVNESAQIIKTLGNSSDQIGEIVAVIDNIADQTNLLALNAAIEAARAGEQGRGFAIVADEVRKLAERTTRATKEIADMIKSIQGEIRKAVSSMEMGTKEVKEGVSLVSQAEMVLKEISLMVQEVMGTIQRIAAAAEEQSAMSEEMSANLEAVARVARDTSSRSAQSCQSSQELNSLALGLQRLVSQFKLHQNGRREVPTTEIVPLGTNRRGGNGVREFEMRLEGSERVGSRLLS